MPPTAGPGALNSGGGQAALCCGCTRARAGRHVRANSGFGNRGACMCTACYKEACMYYFACETGCIEPAKKGHQCTLLGDRLRKQRLG